MNMSALSRALIYSLILVTFVSITTQCKHYPNKNLTGTDTTKRNVIQEDTNICFERDILPLFLSNCATTGCHNSTTRRAGVITTSYNTIMRGITAFDPANSDFYNAIITGFMPPSKLMPADQIALIKKWILQGAKNGTNCPSKCDTSNFVFGKAIQPLINTYCVGCHTGASAGGGIALDSYTGIKSAAQSGVLVKSVDGTAGYSQMPKGGAALNSCQITQIKKWIAAGCQNN